MEELGLKYLLSTIIYSVLGFVLFVAALYAIEKVTHFSVQKEIVEDQNTALGIVIGSIVIAMGIIISAAIH